MESNCHEESINSNEEIDQSEQESIHLGVGRSYDCVFCKRGFNTAQALGGHMNIHRKDRAKNKPINSNKLQEQHLYAGPGLYHQIVPPVPSSIGDPSSAGHHPFASPDHGQIFAYFTPSPSGIGSLYGNYSYLQHQQFLSVDSDCDNRRQQPLDPSEDWSSLSLRFVEDLDRSNRLQEMNQKEELDLELRLGYDS